MSEQTGTGIKKVRGRAKRSTDLIEAMESIAEEYEPITGRGVGYKLFTAGLIPSMARKEMARVYRLLRDAREEGIIPWEWIVDETRELEAAPTWNDPKAFARAALRCYRRDFWNQQPCRVEVWSEKGTVRGVLGPVLEKYAVGFRVMHGFSGATTVRDIAVGDDGRELIALYCGDYDPSGMFMSEEDLPKRLLKYDGDHVSVLRIAITDDDIFRSPPPTMAGWSATTARVAGDEHTGQVSSRKQAAGGMRAYMACPEPGSKQRPGRGHEALLWWYGGMESRKVSMCFRPGGCRDGLPPANRPQAH
jgi:hypothetical protein